MKIIDKNAKRIFNIFLVFAILSFIISLLLLCKYYRLSKIQYISISENSKLDYKVCLKKNNFYDTKCLEKGEKYIASLIDYIPVKFNYSLELPNTDIDYTYTYSVVAEFNVLDKDDKKSLFSKSEKLYESDPIKTSKNSDIEYNLNIDYNKYNDLLNSFISIYDLDETVNSLRVNLYVNILSDGNNKIEKLNKDSVISLSIPLTRKTINIDISGVTSNSNEQKLNVIDNNNYMPLLIMGITLMIICISLVICLVYILKKNRTVNQIYNNRIKKILNLYDSYIQRINGNYPIGASQICKVATFRDMLEIKDSTDKPLLMLENDQKTGTFFIIPVGEGVIYTYALRVEDIIAEKEGEKSPDYNIEDINVQKDKTKRTYTKERIKKDIEKTTSLNIVDDKNAIKGTKNTDENLYSQLEKTMSFKVLKDGQTDKEVKEKRTSKK